MAMRRAQKKWESAHIEERREYRQRWWQERKKRLNTQDVDTNGKIMQKRAYIGAKTSNRNVHNIVKTGD
jgi:hypothetical protein